VSDRLNELQRQRALVQEHLAWLDREIAAEAGGAHPAAAPQRLASQAGAPAPPRPTVLQQPSPTPTNLAQSEAVADEILSKYHVEPQSLQTKVKRGCFMYFFLALLLVGLCALGLFLYSSRK
jgi:hypothetical protein